MTSKYARICAFQHGPIKKFLTPETLSAYRFVVKVDNFNENNKAFDAVLEELARVSPGTKTMIIEGKEVEVLTDYLGDQEKKENPSAYLVSYAKMYQD